MKEWKRFLSLLLATAMCVGLLPVETHAGAYEKLSYSIADGEVTITDCSTDATEVVIPDEIEGYPVTSIGTRAFKECSALTSVTIPNSVTSIGDRAFMDCSSLTSITIPDGVTSIGFCSFYGCTSLVSVALPGGLVSIETGAFFGCTSLTDITLPGSVTSIGNGAFGDCENLTAVSISDLAAWCEIDFEDSNSNPLYYGANFYLDGTPVTDLVIPDGVTSIKKYVFVGCTSLTSVTLPDSLIFIGDLAFRGCINLRSITIPENVISVGAGAFAGTSTLKKIDLADGNKKFSVDEFGVLFDYLRETLIAAPGGLSGSYIIPDGVNSIERRAFYCCNSLTSTTLPDGVISIADSTFSHCASLTSITMPDSITSIGWFAFSGCTSLTDIEIPDSVTFIDCYAFSGCTSLTRITIPEGVDCIWDLTFYNCTSLTSVTLPDSVTAFGIAAFFCCSSLPSITLPDGITYINYSVFELCTSLTSVTIPVGVESIQADAFGHCDALEFIYFKGNAPTFSGGCFLGVTATAYYPEDDATWTEDVRQDYGGNITWVAYDPAHTHDWADATCTAPKTCRTCGATEGEALGHDWDNGKITLKPTPTKDGVRTYTCKTCGDTYTEVVPATGLTPVGPAPVTPAEPELPEEPVLPKNPFADVHENDFFYDAVIWAVNNGITSGSGADTFAPDRACTRAEMVTFLWRAAGKPEPVSGNNPFTDVAEADYFYKAVLWAVENGITKGTSESTFSPNDTCTRGQAVTFLYRYAGAPEITVGNPFADVQENNYYYHAVIWAVAEEITKGTGEANFSPDNFCTRSQIVTFLYRYSTK